jgi:hypothetical protein
MSDASLIRPAGPTPPVAALPPSGQTAAGLTALTDPPVPALAGDSLKTSSLAAGRGAKPASLFAEGQAPGDKPAADRPWRMTSLNIRYAPERVIYGKSTIHFQQPAYGTDLTIKDVQAHDRTSFEYLYTMPNGWPQLDEPQTTVGISGGFANGYGFEANLKHNKYIVGVPGQQVEFQGTLGGQDVSGTHPLSDYVGQYEISGGLNQVSLLGTKSLNLPAFSPKDRFSLIVKAGPGALVTWTNSHLMNDKGEMEQGPRQYHLGGYSLLGETELRYEVRKRVAVSLSNSFSYCHVASSQIAGGGKATHDILASQVALGVGYTFNFKDKHKKPPVDVAP